MVNIVLYHNLKVTLDIKVISKSFSKLIQKINAR